MSRSSDNDTPVNDGAVALGSSLGDIASQAFDKQYRLLQINDMLSRKTDLDLLLECLYTEAQSFVKFDGLSYQIPDSSGHIQIGMKRQSHFSIDLGNGGRDLGTLSIHMKSAPDNREIREIQGLLPGLLYPLETALSNRASKFASWIDDFTGMNNELALAEVLPREMLLSREDDDYLSLLAIDLDHFSKTAEIHGEKVSNEIILTVSDVLTSNLRSTDMIFRIGYDRFVVILGSSDFDDANVVSERLRTCVDRCYSYRNVQLMQSASAGVTEMVAGDTPESLLNRAETALVNAKRAGRNRTRFLAATEQ